MSSIDTAFANTTSVLFGKPLANMESYDKWLLARIGHKIRKAKSKFSGKDVWVVQIDFFDKFGSNVITLGESEEYGKNALSLAEVEKLSIGNAVRALAKISTASPEIIYGENIDTHECAGYGPTQHCFRASFCWFSKKAAYGFWIRDSDSVFGCSNLVLSSFCIRCHSSTNLTRCFEVNDSSASSGCYFCHNVENCQDCMFCFNTKNKRYAIGNVEVGREEFMRIKSLVTASILSELEATHSLRHDIFNIGAGKKK